MEGDYTNLSPLSADEPALHLDGNVRIAQEPDVEIAVHDGNVAAVRLELKKRTDRCLQALRFYVSRHARSLDPPRLDRQARPGALTTRPRSASTPTARRPAAPRRAALEQLDGDLVRRPDERHAPVARRPADRVAELDEALARRVDVVDLVGHVPEVAPAGVRLLLVPVVGQRRRSSRRPSPSHQKRNAAGRSSTRTIVWR
jgi:hypothetical protein